MLHHDHFHEEYQVFRASKYFKLLDQKFKPIPYYKKYNRIKQITFVASYLFNLFSAATASTLIFLFTFHLISYWQFAILVAIVSVAILEIMKRKLSGVIFKEWLSNKKLFILPVFILLLVSSLSVLSSYFGSKELVQKMSSLPVIEQEKTSHLETELNRLDAQIDAARNTTWKGITTTKSQSTIAELTMQRSAVLNQLLQIEQQNNETSLKLIINHQERIFFKAKHFALVTLLLELLFCFSAFYLEYYDYRSYTEFHRSMTKDTNEPSQNILNDTEEDTVQDQQIDISIILAAIKNAKANLAAYKSKIKSGNGTISANQKGIKRWENRLKELYDLLPPQELAKINKKGNNNSVITLF